MLARSLDERIVADSGAGLIDADQTQIRRKWGGEKELLSGWISFASPSPIAPAGRLAAPSPPVPWGERRRTRASAPTFASSSSPPSLIEGEIVPPLTFPGRPHKNSYFYMYRSSSRSSLDPFRIRGNSRGLRVLAPDRSEKVLGAGPGTAGIFRGMIGRPPEAEATVGWTAGRLM